MALINASTTKTNSDSNQSTPDITNVIIDEINTDIGAAAAAGEYKLETSYEARINSDTTEIKGSDSNYIDVDTIIFALKSYGYRVSCKGSNSENRAFRLYMTVAWS